LADQQKHVENRWNGTAKMLKRVSNSLDLCCRTAGNVSYDEDMKLALIEACIALITFWAEAVRIMRDHPYGLMKLS
jgi:hypothetical protein